jgi:hypothetical protein
MAGQPQMNLLWLTLVLYPFGAGAMAVNVFFASLIWSWAGWPVLTPLQSVLGGLALGIPVTYAFARHIHALMTKADASS